MYNNNNNCFFLYNNIKAGNLSWEDSALARVISAGMYSSISASSSYLYTIIEDISDSEISEIAR